LATANTDLIRNGYDAWNRGDVDGVMAVLDPAVEWQGYAHLPESGTLSGRAEVRAWLERFLEAWEELEIELTELIESGERVVALVRFHALGKGSGARVEGGVDAHVWTVRDNRVVAVKLYQGTREALEEARPQG
jgi:ketosteroid isomerase-like protein